MPSILPGYEYDIFISYRLKDNRGERWVTGFVDALRTELGATFKEDITVYFDENPKDGLLEMHRVDESLANKLKSIILIPIISQTYCDPKSFAWNSELLPFLEYSAKDPFGLNITLANGNVASRVLPVRIHELDDTDKGLLEEQIGPLRSVEFIFQAPGVNRPLTPLDPSDKNSKRTTYRNQVNKVCNGIKEIISGMRSGISNGETGRKQVKNVIPSASVAAEKSIAVLPFVNMSNDPEQEYFSDGISEEIINTLVQLPNLKVAGRTSAFSFKNKNEDLRQIAEKLNVNTVLEGSVRKAGNRIRITAQLIEASTGFHLWSQKFDRELSDVFIIQDEIAKAIVDQLKVTLSGRPAEPKERIQTHNVEAYQLYLKGMALFYKRGLDMFEGLRCFEAALKLDASYALAMVGVADSYSMLCFHSFMAPEVAWPKAIAAAKSALGLAPDLSEAHCSMGTIALLCERDWPKAEVEYKKSLELNPKYLQARAWYALFYLQIVKHNSNEAIKQAQLAVENDPLSAYSYIILCAVYGCSGRYKEAIDAGLKAVEYDPGSFSSWNFLGNAYHWTGDIASSMAPYKKALEISGRHVWTLTTLVVAYVTNNQKREAEILHNELLTKAKLSYVSPTMLAITSAALGKPEDAVRYAREALLCRDPCIVQMTSDVWPDSKALREIEQYQPIAKLLAFG
jgi:adenylate cyclase